MFNGAQARSRFRQTFMLEVPPSQKQTDEQSPTLDPQLLDRLFARMEELITSNAKKYVDSMCVGVLPATWCRWDRDSPHLEIVVDLFIGSPQRMASTQDRNTTQHGPTTAIIFPERTDCRKLLVFTLSSDAYE